MARIDSFLKKWASAPSQFERPADALIDRGWAGGAAEDPPEAKWENWWHNRVDEALAEVESNGALSWFVDVPYGIGSTAHNGGKNWIAAIANTGIEPTGGDNVGHWIELGAGATETVAGPSKVATQAQTDAGTDDATIVTPRKLRMGFAISIGVNGYIAFPTWMLGFIIQWGLQSTPSLASGATTQGAVTLPTTFPSALRAVVLTYRSIQGGGVVGYTNPAPNSFSYSLRALTNLDASDLFFIAVGR